MIASKPTVPLAALAAISALALALQLLLTRMLAYTVPALLVYVVLGIALLGFGAAGSVVALRPAWADGERLATMLASWSLAFAAVPLPAYAIFVRIAPRAVTGYAWTAASAVLLAAPFVCAGVVVALSLSAAGKAPGRTYGANLVGSAAGCFLPVGLLAWLDAPRVLAALGVASAAIALAYAARVRGRLRARLVGAALSVGAAWGASLVFADRIFPLSLDPMGQMAAVERHARKHAVQVTAIYDRWSAVGRAQVFDFSGVPDGPSPYPFRFYVQDGDAGALVARWDGRTRSALGDRYGDEAATGVPRLCLDTPYGQAHYRRRERVLVIGLGGGADVQCALFHGAARIDAIDINPAVVQAIRGPLDAYLGGIGRDPRVTYHVRDGRSFARAQPRRQYDLVTLSGADTKALSSSGALALDENMLHTVEAVGDYLDVLTFEGVLAIIRFGEFEALRLAATVHEALARTGATHPESHVIIVQNGVTHGLVVRRTPFPAAEREAHRRHYLDPSLPFRGLDVFFFRPLEFLVPTRPVVVFPGEPRALRFVDYFDHLGRGQGDAYAATLPLEVRPATDDKPFFFDLARYDRKDVFGHLHVRLMLHLFAGILAVAVLAILIPPWRRRAAFRGTDGGFAVAYFAALGLGYLLIEIWLIHRFGMFLGHQTYSVSAVLAFLLLGTGVGAVVGERRFPSPGERVRVGAALALGILAVGVVGLPSAFDLALALPVGLRLAVTAAYLVPLGASLGFAFPAGLTWAASRSPAGVPWCVGVNGFASVLASVIAVPIAHVGGYATVLQSACVLYAFVLVASSRLAVRE